MEPPSAKGDGCRPLLVPFEFGVTGRTDLDISGDSLDLSCILGDTVGGCTAGGSP